MQSTTHHPSPPSPSAATTPSAAPVGWEETYLDALAESGQKAKAARAAGISLRLLVRRRHHDSTFAQLELEAQEASFDMMESEAIRRAVEGVAVSRPGRNGEIITRIIYSDTLLFKILQHHVWNKPPNAPDAPITYPTAADRRAALDKAMAAAEAAKRFLRCDPQNRPQPRQSPPA